MRVFVMAVLDRQVWVLPCGDDDNLRLLALNGPRKEDGLPAPMRVILEDETGRRRISSDMPWYSEHVLVLHDRLLGAVRPLPEAYGKFLPQVSVTPITLTWRHQRYRGVGRRAIGNHQVR
jgi:hypothetical protein